MAQKHEGSQQMTDKYQLVSTGMASTPDWQRYNVSCDGKPFARIQCNQDAAALIDRALNQQSRAGSKTSQAKREAARRNAGLRWASSEVKAAVDRRARQCDRCGDLACEDH